MNDQETIKALEEENAQLKETITRMVDALTNARDLFSRRIVEALDIARNGPGDTDD